MKTMYPGMLNSPTATLSEEFTLGDNHIHVNELASFPAAPNIATIGTDDDACTYEYTGKSAESGTGTLTGVTVLEGTDRNWDLGTSIARNIAAYDLDTLRTNLELSPSNMARNAIVNSNFDVWQRLGTLIETTKRARASNVATLTTSAAHNLAAGDYVIITGLGGTGYVSSGVVVASAPTTTSFTYANTGSDETETADTGGDIYCYSHPVFVSPANSAWTADRWRVVQTADGGTFPSVKHTRGTITPGAVDGSMYSYKLTTDGAGSSLGVSSIYRITQSIHRGVSLFCGSGNTVTVSFRAKSTIANKRIGIYLTQVYGTGGSAAVDVYGTNFTLTSDWQLFSHTFTLTSLSGKTVTEDNYLALRIMHVWGTTTDVTVGASTAETFVGAGDIEITQAQLCAGDVALDYMPPDPEQELVLCLLDYERYGRRGIHEERLANGFCHTTTSIAGVMVYSTKRVNPTVTVTGALQVYYEGPAAQVISGGAGFAYPSTNRVNFSLDFSGAVTVGHGAYVRLDADGQGMVEIVTGW